MGQQLWWSWQNCIPCTQRNSLSKMNFFPKNIILNLFSDFGRRNSGLFAQIFAKCVKTVFYPSRKNIKQIPEKFFLGALEKTLIWTKKLQVCQKSFLPLQENNFLGETKLCSLSGSDWKLNGCLGKNGLQICQKRIPRDKRILLRKMKFLSKKKIRLWIHFLNYSETRSFFFVQ